MLISTFFSLLARQLGIAAILPWAIFSIFCAFLFLVGQWLVRGIQIAHHTDPTTPSKVASFENSYEANILVSKLAEDGIRATTAGTFTSGFQAESPGLADVFVAKEDLQNAQRVIAELAANSQTQV